VTNRALGLPGYTDAIDVSQVQRIANAQRVYDAGFRVAWAKSSEGVGYCDPRVRRFLAELEGAGLLVSIYSFVRVSGGPAASQAEKLFACAGDVFRTKTMLDLETAAKGVPSTQLCDFAEAFVERVLEEGVSTPTLYTYTSFLRERLMPEIAKRPRLVALDLHVAQYRSVTAPWAPSSSADMPRALGPWGDAWKLWQYSGNKGYPVDGIEGDCDRNLIRGNEPEVRRWMGYPPVGFEPDMGGTVWPAVPLGRPALDD
jgi:GH25 family lysozyme M1 (1,4-beta-N-acetylmuramidase)